MDAEPKAFMPPYNISWTTFLSTLERMAADPPSRVDRSYLDSQSGTVQTYLIAAYKSFNLINDEARPTEAVNAFADPDRRKPMIAELIVTNYPTILQLADRNSTPGELAESFSDAFPSLTGESRVKAIRFFLSAAAYADLKLSPLWKAPKAPRGSSAGRRPSRNGKASQAGQPLASPTPPRSKPQSMEEAKLAYFDLLITSASKGTQLDPDLLDRIELLVGVSEGRSESGNARSEDPDRSDTQPAPSTSDSLDAN